MVRWEFCRLGILGVKTRGCSDLDPTRDTWHKLTQELSGSRLVRFPHTDYWRKIYSMERKLLVESLQLWIGSQKGGDMWPHNLPLTEQTPNSSRGKMGFSKSRSPVSLQISNLHDSNCFVASRFRPSKCHTIIRPGCVSLVANYKADIVLEELPRSRRALLNLENEHSSSSQNICYTSSIRCQTSVRP
jgi:hypothetical protein